VCSRGARAGTQRRTRGASAHHVFSWGGVCVVFHSIFTRIPSHVEEQIRSHAWPGSTSLRACQMKRFGEVGDLERGLIDVER